MLGKGYFLNQRNKDVADDDCVGHALCGAAENPEQSRKHTQQDAEHNLALWRDGAGHIVGCHEESTENQAAAAQVGRNIVQIKSMASEQDGKYHNRQYVGTRNPDGDYLLCQKISSAD